MIRWRRIFSFRAVATETRMIQKAASGEKQMHDSALALLATLGFAVRLMNGKR
jgi:hypothetical protein